MASSSVSFRITRSTEDLAETIHLLSQRLVSFEQRLAALELQLSNLNRPDPQEQGILDHVDRLLLDCRDLLGLDGTGSEAGTGGELSDPAADTSRPAPLQAELGEADLAAAA